MDFQPKKNPLADLMRQPKIYVKLPSNGQFWKEGSLDLSVNGEYPVYSMTAKDELMLKIPDALLSGQAVVEVIQNCMPNIKNAWNVPNIDLDIILIAIRIATYGETMKIPLIINEEEFDYQLDLRFLMNQLEQQIIWEPRVEISSDLIAYVKPFTYKQISETSIHSFETQKILQIANNDNIDDESKNKIFKAAFDKLNNFTIGIINNSVFKIESVHGTTEELEFIKEFMENSDKEVFDIVKKHIEKIRDHNTLKPLKIKATPEMIAAGGSEEIEIPLNFDPSNFFA